MAQAAKPKKAAVDPATDTADVVEPKAPAVSGPDAVSDSVEPDATDGVPVTLDTKSAFQAALERKKQAGQARSAHLDGHGGVGGATSSHKATRTFRRKSGSA